MTRAVLRSLLVLTTLAALAPAPASAAERFPNPATMVIATKEYVTECARCGPGGTPTQTPGCDYAIFAQFPHVSGAKSYNVVVRDKHPSINRTRNLTGPPFNDGHEGYKTPAGVHWLGGLTGGGGPTCPTDPYEGGRFEIVSSTVTFGDEGRIVGYVTRASGGDVGGVRVAARGPGSASARTNAAGFFSMKVRRGRWSVSAPGYCVKRRGRAGSCDRSATVSVRKGPERVDFREQLRPELDVVLNDRNSPDDPAVDVSFTGKGWDPDGGPIVVRWSGRPKWTHLFSPDDGNRARDLLRQTPSELRIPAAREFDGRLVSELWPRHSSLSDQTPRCSGRLTATQDGATLSGTVRTDQTRGVILWSEGNPDFDREDLFCDGEYTDIGEGPKGPIPSVASGRLVIYDVYSNTWGHYRASPRSSMPFKVNGPAPGDCPAGDSCETRAVCLDKPGTRDVSIFWDVGLARRGRLVFRWVTSKPCSETGKAGLVLRG